MIFTSLLEDTLPIEPGVIRTNCFPIEYRAASILNCIRMVVFYCERVWIYHFPHTDFPVDTIHEDVATPCQVF